MANLELISFVFCAIVFMLWGWNEHLVVPVLLSTLFWWCSAWWWLTSLTNLPTLALAFVAVGGVNVLKVFVEIYHAFRDEEQ